jgi:hypothetical protein
MRLIRRALSLNGSHRFDYLILVAPGQNPRSSTSNGITADGTALSR